jgi:hypothetical protein
VSGRAVGRMAGLTQSSAQRALTRLREDGLVLVEPAPPSLLYRANHEHLAMPALVGLLQPTTATQAGANPPRTASAGRPAVP